MVLQPTQWLQEADAPRNRFSSCSSISGAAIISQIKANISAYPIHLRSKKIRKHARLRTSKKLMTEAIFSALERSRHHLFKLSNANPSFVLKMLPRTAKSVATGNESRRSLEDICKQIVQNNQIGSVASFYL